MATPTPTMELLAAVRDMLNAHAKTVTGDDAAACEAAAEAVNAAFRFIDPDDDCDPPDDPPPDDPPEERARFLATCYSLGSNASSIGRLES